MYSHTIFSHLCVYVYIYIYIYFYFLKLLAMDL